MFVAQDSGVYAGDCAGIRHQQKLVVRGKGMAFLQHQKETSYFNHVLIFDKKGLHVYCSQLASPTALVSHDIQHLKVR